MIKFTTENHQYKSIDPNEDINWLSVTKFIALFKPKFDEVTASEKASKNKKSKWYGIPPVEIRNIWEKEKDRSISTGSFYHEQREIDVLGVDSIKRNGIDLPIFAPIIQDNIKYAPTQRLVQGIYPEHLAYLKSAGICGQADRIEVFADVVDVFDYKTNKEIKKEGFRKYDGTVDKMYGPCAHLDDCNYSHYSLQLSVYMYMILKHNPNLKPGKLVLQHVKFKKERDDEYGYPIYFKDSNGDPVVHEVVQYDVRYLEKEVIGMINHLKLNK
jgi:hypothetical protein